MRRWALTAALLTVLPAAIRAQARAPVCVALAGVGCYFVPDSAEAEPPLLVFLRGHYGEYKGDVPAEKCLQSARQAFSQYGLAAVAESNGTAVLAVCSSHTGVTDAVVQRLEAASGRRFSRRVLVAHSGGYVGLRRTLRAGTTVHRILILDAFYDDDDSLARLVQLRVSAGAACAGYYTAHNKTRYEAHFRPNAQCLVEDMGPDSEHDAAVARCLDAYMKRGTCQ